MSLIDKAYWSILSFYETHTKVLSLQNQKPPLPPLTPW